MYFIIDSLLSQSGHEVIFSIHFQILFSFQSTKAWLRVWSVVTSCFLLRSYSAFMQPITCMLCRLIFNDQLLRWHRTCESKTRDFFIPIVSRIVASRMITTVVRSTVVFVLIGRYLKQCMLFVPIYINANQQLCVNHQNS